MPLAISKSLFVDDKVLTVLLLVQTWKMLTNLVSFKEVVNYLYGNMRETSHLRDRCPQPANWMVAEMLADELDYPCKVVIKTQDQGH